MIPSFLLASNVINNARLNNCIKPASKSCRLTLELLHIFKSTQIKLLHAIFNICSSKALTNKRPYPALSTSIDFLNSILITSEELNGITAQFIFKLVSTDVTKLVRRVVEFVAVQAIHFHLALILLFDLLICKLSRLLCFLR